MSRLESIARNVRHSILTSTTRAGSGHPSSSLSAVELMTTLMFGGYFRFDIPKPNNPNNDRLIFSKGHAAPLLYALWAEAGAIKRSELAALRKFTTRLEGHPTMRFPYTEAATGSLGQGLSIGVGMALAAKYSYKTSYRTFVLLGDSEMAEGSVWEAARSAAFYKLDNIIAILDMNRLGQRGETMYGWNAALYKRQFQSFGWNVITVDGHSIEQVNAAYRQALTLRSRPVIIIAKTVKGKGVSFMENKEGWHGRALNDQELSLALSELGPIDLKVTAEIRKPLTAVRKLPLARTISIKPYRADDAISTRQAYGDALVRFGSAHPEMVVLDAEVSNSTYADRFKKAYPKRFFEMYIAEQNMLGVAVGMARRGLKPFVSSFAAFLTRAFDQVRMAQYSGVDMVIAGSHAGVSIGEDGPSQMGLEDIALFRSIQNSIVLYPCDGVSTQKVVEQAGKSKGITYIRTTRAATPIIYPMSQAFPIGGSKVLRQSRKDVVTIVAAGITVYEALAAYDMLKKQKINVRIIDLYSVKPLDVSTLQRAAQQTGCIITVEDHVPEGGIGEAVAATVSHLRVPVHSLAVRKNPRSGTSHELLAFEEISRDAIVNKVLEKRST